MALAAPEKPKPLSPDHRIVLDFLCASPCRVYDFTEVAEATKLKRGRAEAVIVDLTHQRYGSPLKRVGPDGMKLRPRHAYLPFDSPARAGYPACAPPDFTAAEHPTLAAIRKGAAEEAARLEAEARERSDTLLERSVVHGDYRKRKAEAREKARERNPALRPERFTTGLALPEGAGRLGPAASAVAAPPVPSALLEPRFQVGLDAIGAEEPARELPASADDLPSPSYRKNAKGPKR